MSTVFICDDEAGILRYLDKLLRKNGYDVETFLRGGDLLEAMSEVRCDVILLDVRMPDLDGLQILMQLCKEYPNVPVLLMTGHGTMNDAVQAIKLGAFDYLTKPFPLDKILEVIGRAVSQNHTKKALDGDDGI